MDALLHTINRLNTVDFSCLCLAGSAAGTVIGFWLDAVLPRSSHRRPIHPSIRKH